MTTAHNVTTARAATEPRHATAADFRHFLPFRSISSLPPLPEVGPATSRFLRTVVLPRLLLALRTADSAARTALPAFLLALRGTLAVLRTAWQTRDVWGPALRQALQHAFAELRTAWQNRGVWGPALLRAVRNTPAALRTAWRTRGVWAPALLVRTRAGLAELWAGTRARPIASPTALLLVAAAVTTGAGTRPADLGSPRIAPAAHTTARHQAAQAQAAQGQTAQGQTAQGQTAQGQTAQGQTAAQPAAAPAPQCTVPTPPAPPAGVTDEQVANAKTIAQVAYDRGLSDRAVVIAVATAMQESKLSDIDYGDRDSLGLFQQRPSQGWGTPQQILDPSYAAGQFYDRLVQVPGWDTARLTDAAQSVQRSGFPEAYQQWEGLATALTATVKPAAPVCG